MSSIKKYIIRNRIKKNSYVFDELEQKVIMCVQKMCSLINWYKVYNGFEEEKYHLKKNATKF